MLQCVIDEFESGAASDMYWEPLLGSPGSSKTYDENGVTENSTISSDETMDDAKSISLLELEPSVYYDAMEYASCY